MTVAAQSPWRRRARAANTLFLSLATVLSVAVPGAAAKPSKYQTDLIAFFGELDKTYPFFDLKKIRKGWPSTKKRLLSEVRRCSSDEQFLGLVLEIIRYLRDGHMGFAQVNATFPKAEPEYYPGISFMPATKNRVIVMSAVNNLLRPGTVITHIDRKPARRLLEAHAQNAWAKGGYFSSPQRARLFAYRIPLRGTKGDKHRITCLSGKRKKTTTFAATVAARGWPHTYNMPEGLTQHGRSCWYGRLKSSVGYIYLRRIDRSTEPGIAAALAANPEAKGWIIDLRGNGGGGYSGQLIKRIAGLPRPVAGLIDAGCYSAGETLARDIARYAAARLFGSTTAGSSSAKRTWTFPSGIGTIIIPTRSRTGLGKCIEYNGITAHEPVEAVPEEVAAGKNSAVLRAEAYLLKARPVR